MRRPRRDPTVPVGLWPFPVALAVIVALGLAVSSVAGWLLWLGLGRPVLGVGTPLDPAAQLDLVRIALVVTGGLGGVVALVVAYRRQRIAEDSNQRENTKLFNERFITATTQLGHDSAAVRLAGMYALASLADDWHVGRSTCVDVLCAYIRMPYQPDRDQPGWREGEREVRLSILRLIASGASRWTSQRTFDFTSATFDGGDFSMMTLHHGTYLVFDEATFAGGTTSFANARLNGGFLMFDRAVFAGGTVSFTGTTFAGGIVDPAARMRSAADFRQLDPDAVRPAPTG